MKFLFNTRSEGCKFPSLLSKKQQVCSKKTKYNNSYQNTYRFGYDIAAGLAIKASILLQRNCKRNQFHHCSH
jgi:hypothetical protein